MMRREVLSLLLGAWFASPVLAQWPDRGGYRFLDSDTAAGPSFQWDDITGPGVRLAIGDDDNLGPFALGFRFRPYGVEYDSVRICSNGWLSFTSSSHQFHHYSIPSPDDPNALLAALWLDLDPTQGGTVRYWADTSQARFVVSWLNVAIHDTNVGCTFQVVLDSSGSIEFRYLALPWEMRVGGFPSAVGIEDDSGLVGSEYLQDSLPTENRLHDSLTVRFYQLRHDVCPELIARPWFFSLAGESIAPLVTVWNPGTEPATFPVVLRIGTAYEQQVGLTLGALDDTLLSFPVWVPGADSYPMQTFTLLGDDGFGANDTVRGFTCGSYVGQLRYDDGDPDTWFLRVGAPTVDWAAAVRFSSPYERYRLLGAVLLLNDTQPFQRVLVCPDSSGTPKLGSPYFEADSVGAPEPASWLEVDCDTEVVREGDIWLVAYWPRRANGPQVGDDRSAPVDGRSWFGSSMTGWVRHTAGDLVARLKVDGRTGIEELLAAGRPALRVGPTPFRNRLVVSVSRAHLGVSGTVRDAEGRVVRRFVVDGRSAAWCWDARNDAGVRVPAGAYFVAVGVAGSVAKVLLVR